MRTSILPDQSCERPSAQRSINDQILTSQD
jgi:hypothetical protein